ncbi:MAG: acyl-CoA thioesterase [Pseudomonadota bacterium]|jgi:acyl-CoA thioester hydrolase
MPADITIPPEFKPMLTTAVAVRWGDMDAQGHVNNVQYFRFTEQARIEWFDRYVPERHGDGTGPVVAQTGCRFLRSIVYPASIEVQVYCAPPGRSSFRHRYLIRDVGDPSIVYAEADAVMVWIDPAAGRSMPLPDRVREVLPAA